jgi:hypothetical protein
MSDRDFSEDEEFDFGAWQHKEDERALSPAGIADQNRYMLSHYRAFREAADAVAVAWSARPEVVRVALIGSVARMPYKEVPRFSVYRRARIELWHECMDVDVALWLDDMGDLNGLRKEKDRVLRNRQRSGEGFVANHQIDVFVLDPATSRYLGRLCTFNQCPKGKIECLVEGCGSTPFLQLHQDFRWRADSLAPDRSLTLYDRGAGSVAKAADLPLPEGDGDADAEAGEADANDDLE